MGQHLQSYKRRQNLKQQNIIKSLRISSRKLKNSSRSSVAVEKTRKIDLPIKFEKSVSKKMFASRHCSIDYNFLDEDDYGGNGFKTTISPFLG